MKHIGASFAVAMTLLASAVCVNSARAEWPDRTITIIVPFAPGGSNDLLGRLLAAELAPALGQSVIVENRVGGNGNIGTAAGARAAPDGYTLLVVGGVVMVNPFITKVSYDPIKDFAPIAYMGASPQVLVTRPASGIATVAELVARAKAEPGKLTFATAGTGSISQLAVELLKLRAGIDLTHVPFSGGAPALQAAIAGTTDIASVNIAGLIGYLQSGALRALVQSGAERWPDLPDVPIMREAGIADAVVDTSVLLFAPAGTSAPIVDRLARETRRILAKPDVVEKMAKASFAVKYEGPDDLRARMVRETAMWKELVERSGIGRQ